MILVVAATAVVTFMGTLALSYCLFNNKGGQVSEQDGAATLPEEPSVDVDAESPVPAESIDKAEDSV